jgi:Sulfotransferase domain
LIDLSTTRINLISSPRNISTAMMYSFAQRLDTTVVDEPFYAYYLRKTGKQHPGREEVLKTQSSVPEQIINEVLFGQYDTGIVFFKQMAHHFTGLDTGFLKKMKNILLIRSPEAMIASFTKVIPDITIYDIGIKHAFELYKELNTGKIPVTVIDSGYLLQYPEGVLKQLCQILEIPFDANMLKWDAGAQKEDGVWAKYWYANVHQSTGFLPYKPKEIRLRGKLNKVVQEANEYYSVLLEKALK